MASNIIDGKALALKKEQSLKEKLAKLNFKPKIVSILIGDDPASLIYTKMKQKKAQSLGINFDFIKLPVSLSFTEIAMDIIKLNQDPQVNGIMIQLPVPEQFLKGKSIEELLDLIDPKKDVDGLTESSKFLPAVVKAVITILKEEEMDLKNKFVAVLGESKWVGLPIAKKLKELGAIVTICNENTPNTKDITQRADLIVTATGVKGVLTGEMVKTGVVVIDVGTLLVGNNSIIGDVDFETVSKKAFKITPVPGGVGPLTVISLMENVVEAVN